MSRKTPTVDIFSRLSAVIKKTHDRADKEIATFANSVNFVEPRIYDAFRKMITGA